LVDHEVQVGTHVCDDWDPDIIAYSSNTTYRVLTVAAHEFVYTDLENYGFVKGAAVTGQGLISKDH